MGFGLDSIIASYVKPHLSEFFVDFTDENMSVGFSSVTMTNMQLRPDVVEKFGVPFTVYGSFGEIAASLSIGWSMSLSIDIKDIFLLVIPPTSIPFDPEKEASRIIETKRKEIEDYFATEKAKAEAEASKNEAPGAMAGFITGLINSLTLNIHNIHIRYEDSVTRPKHPYSAGLVLKSLTAESRGPDYEEGTSPTEDTFFKLVKLTGLGTYWNSNSKLLVDTKDTSPAAITATGSALKQELDDDSGLQYFIGPLAAALKAMVTLKPQRLEEPFSLPTADVSLELEEIGIGLTNLQLTDAAILGDSVENIFRSRPFRKFRPNVPVSKNAKQWWQFAYNSVLIDVRRRKQDWSWERMKELKTLKDEYREKYFTFLSNDSPSDEDKEEIQNLEDKINNFNVILIRKEVQEKHEMKVAFVKDKESQGSWYSRVTVTPEEIEEYLKDNFTEEERKKIFDAVDYSKDAPPPVAVEFPKDFVRIKVAVKLPKLGLRLKQLFTTSTTGAGSEVFDFGAHLFDIGFQQRPGSEGLTLNASIGSINVSGFGSDEKRPAILRSVTDKEGENYLDLVFEKNPLDLPAGTKIKLKIQPLEIVYDSTTIQKILDCVALPPDVNLTKLKEVAKSKANEVRARQAAKIKTLAKNTEAMDVDITIFAPYVLVPERGFLSSHGSCLILNLGNLDIQGRPRQSSDEIDINAIDKAGHGDAKDDISPELLKAFYNQFQIKLSDVEVLLTYAGENIYDVLRQESRPNALVDSPTSLVKAGDIVVNFDQGIVMDDPRFPKMRANVSVPLIDVEITDSRLMQLLKLVTTLPLPKTAPKPDDIIPPDPNFGQPAASDLNAVDFNSIVESDKKEDVERDPEKAEQFTDFALELKVEKIKLGFWQLNRESSTKEIRSIVNLSINQLSTKFKARTFGASIDVAIASLQGTYPNAVSTTGQPLYFLESSSEESGLPFVKVHMYNLTKDIPKKYSALIKQKIQIDVLPVNITLHQESLKTLLSIGDAVGKQLAAAKPKKAVVQPAHVMIVQQKGAILIGPVQAFQVSSATLEAFPKKEKTKDPNAILVQLAAKLGGINLQIVSNTKQMAQIHLAGVTAFFEDKHQITTIKADLTTLAVNNLEVDSLYPKIISLHGSEKLISANITLHKDKSRPPAAPETEIQLSMGNARINVIGTFLGNLIGFASSLSTPTAKKAVREGAASTREATGKAASAAANYANDTRILFDIKLAAPDIIIPKEETSLEALYFNFGNLVIQNQLKSITTGTAGEGEAVFDDLAINLTGVKASRVILDKASESILTESYILSPLEFKVDLSRNLSSGWYRELPKINVNADLKPTLLAASSGDIGFALTSILNMTNGLTAGQPPPVKIPETPVPVAKATPGGSEGIGLQPVGFALKGRSLKQPKPLVNLNADFKVEKLEFTLYHEESSLEGKNGLVPRNPLNAFGHMVVDGIGGNARMLENNNLEARVVLQDLIFDDTRKEASVINEFIVRSDEASKGDPVLQAQFSLSNLPNGTKSTDITLKTAALDFILNMQYINLIAKYGTEIADGLPRPKKKVKEVAVEVVEAVVEELEQIEIPELPPPPLVDADINISAIRLIVLENPQSLETNALMISLDGNVNMKTDSGVSSGKGGLRFSSSTAKYENSTFVPVANIIYPAELTLEANIDPTKGIGVNLNLSDIKIHFSAGTLLLISKIGTSFSAATKSKQAGVKDEIELDDFSEIWKPIDNEYGDYAFLRPKSKTELKALTDAPASLKSQLEENASLKSGRITISIEVGSGTMATPLIVLESHLNLEAKNWSSNLSVDGVLDLVCAYNNLSNGMWEYIIETVEVKPEGGFGPVSRKPWGLRFNVAKPKPNPNNPKPLQISLSAPDPLDLTISKSAIGVINEIVKCFSIAARGIGASEADIESAPFVVKNFSGALATVNIENSPFYTVNGIEIIENQVVNVEDGKAGKFGLHVGGIGNTTGEQKERILRLAIPEYNFEANINVNKQQTRFFPLAGQNDGLTVTVKGKESATFVILSGAIEVENHLDQAVDVLSSAKGAMAFIGTVKPRKFICVPVSVNAASIDGLTFKVNGYENSSVFELSKFAKGTEVTEPVTAKPSNPDTEPFAIQVVGKSSEVVLENTESVTTQSKRYSFVLKIPLIINNLLTVPLEIVAGKIEKEIAQGSNLNLNIEPGGYYKTEYKLLAKFSGYERLNWSTIIDINDKNDLLNDAAFDDEKKERKIYFKFEKVVQAGVTTINLFAPYWMVNRTELDLHYRTNYYFKNEFKHEGKDVGPFMFGYETYGSKITADMRISEKGEWGTSGINLDTLGLSIGYICKVPDDREYNLVIEIAMTGNKLTKFVTILPRYVVTNACPYPVILREVDTDEEVILPPNSAKPFWPKGKENKFTLQVPETLQVTPAVYFNRNSDALLPLKNQFGGIRTNVKVTDTTASIILSEFSPAEVPILIVNDTTDLKIDFGEEGANERIALEPGNNISYAWSNPTTAEKRVFFSPENGEKIVDEAVKDGTREFAITRDDHKDTYKWLSFSNGIQRVFVFTQSEEVISSIADAAKMKESPPSMHLQVMLDGIGLSLVNNIEGKDLLYVYVDNTDVIWESKSAGAARYQALGEEFTMILEHGYQNYIKGALTDRPANLTGGITIDYQDFSMTKPEEKKLRRRPYRPGIGIDLKLFPLGLEVDLQISKLQIDNQDPSASEDQTMIFAAVPLKNAPGTDTDAAPSIIIVSYRKMRFSGKSQVNVVKGDIIIQEFSLAANMGLIDDILDVVGSEETEKEKENALAHLYKSDYSSASQPNLAYFEQYVEQAKSANTITIFESFRIFTLKFYLTFTVAGGHSGINPLKTLVMGLGAILANISKVHFEVKGFEVVKMRMTDEELATEIGAHYKSGIISNLYTLVLKLNVLGNPFKLLTGIGGGLTGLLTDPVQGAMEGRFVGGVADGVVGLLDGTVGNLTDSLSKITGALGQGLEALHLRGLSDLVNVLSWGLGGVSKLTHKSEPRIEKSRPRRVLTPNQVIPVYSYDWNIINAMQKYIPQDTGPVLQYMFNNQYLLLMCKNSCVYMYVYPQTLSAPSITWTHKWSEFSGVAPNPQKNTEIIFHLATGGWLADKTLEVETKSSEMGKWLTEVANEIFKKK